MACQKSVQIGLQIFVKILVAGSILDVYDFNETHFFLCNSNDSEKCNHNYSQAARRNYKVF